MLRNIATNPFIGMPGTDGYLLINEMYLQICQVVPEDSYKVAFNTAIQRPIPVAFMSAISQIDTITSQNINIHFRTATYKPDFVFVIFKDITGLHQGATSTSQRNGTLNSNADIKDLQVSLNGEFYPVLTQDAHWGTDYRSTGINRFYEQFRQCCMKFSGECSMSYKQFRDLYPIFAFDLTAQTNKIRNTNVVFDIVGTRNSMTPTTMNMYTIVIYEKYFEASYLNNMINLKSSVPHMEDIQRQMQALQSQLSTMGSGFARVQDLFFLKMSCSMPETLRGSNVLQLEHMIKALGIPYYKGYYSKDELKNIEPSENECLLINLQDSTDGNGTHHLAVWKRGNDLRYFDSYGCPIPQEILDYYPQGPQEFKYYRTLDNVYPDKLIQKLNSDICGELCVLFLFLSSNYDYQTTIKNML